MVNNDRIVWAYVPASYDENILARYPVIFMQDGQNLFDAAKSVNGVEWYVDEALDAGNDDGSIREILVIAPEQNANRIAEYSPAAEPSFPQSTNFLGPQYVDMLTNELKPLGTRSFEPSRAEAIRP
ncbi:MAG: alpha/beta hydrolase-fold protein [Polyangiaceae bacterium]